MTQEFIERCKKFTVEVIRLTDKLPKKSAYWTITDQVVRSSASIGANIAEAKSSTSRLEYKRFFEIALRSGNETVYWFSLLEELVQENPQNLSKLQKELKELNSIIASSILKLRQSPPK